MSFAPLHDSNLLGREAVEAVNQRIDLRFESGCVGVRVRRKDSVNKRDERLLLRRNNWGGTLKRIPGARPRKKLHFMQDNC